MAVPTKLPVPQETAAPAGRNLAVSDSRQAVTRGFSWRRYNPDDLVTRKGLKVYDDMRLDEQVKACLAVKKLAIIGPGWKLEPGDDSAEAQTLADEMTGEFQNLPGTFEDVLLNILQGYDYGFSLNEKTFVADGDTVRVEEIRSIAPHDIYFEEDGFGHVTAIYQMNAGSNTPMPVDKFIHFVHQPEFGNPYGTSDLRAAYRPWWHKSNWIQWWAIWGEKLADQPVKVSYPTGTSVDKITAVLDVVDKMQAKTALAVPEGWNIELVESGRNVRDVFLTSKDSNNVDIGKAILVPDKIGLVGGAVQGGSYSLAKSQLGIFLFILDQGRARLVACVQEQLIDQLADLKAPGVAAPKFVILPLDDDNVAAILEVVNHLTQSGALMLDLEDENHIRQLLKFPEVTEQQRAELEAKKQAQADAEMQRQKELATAKAEATNANPRVPDARPGPGNSAGGGPPAAATTTMAEPSFPRELTPLETRADMAEKAKAFEDLTPPFADAIAQATLRLVNDLKETVKLTGAAKPDASPEALAAVRLNPSVLAHLRTEVETNLREGYNRGVTDAQGEVARAKEQS